MFWPERPSRSDGLPAIPDPKHQNKWLGGVGRALSNRNYRYYAAGHVAHVHGWWGNRMGLGWMMWELTNSPTWLGIMAFAVSVPVLVISPLGGAVSDRYGHRRVAIISGVLGSVTSLAIGILALTGHAGVAVLIGLGLVQGTLFGFDFPSRQALIPQLVERKDISAAVAFNAATFQVGTFLGPLLAGVVIVAFGGGASVLLYAASTLWMVIMISRIPIAPIARPPGEEAGIFADMIAGFRYIAASPPLRIIFILMLSTGVLFRPTIELMPGYADTVFGQGAGGLAILNAAAGIGSLTAATFLAIRGRTQGLTTIMIVGACMGGSLLVVFTQINLFVLALIPLALAAMGYLSAQVGFQSLVQNIAVPEMRGRVIAVHSAFAAGAPALGAIAIGALAEVIGLPLALALAGAGVLVIMLVSIPAIRRHRAEMEADPTV